MRVDRRTLILASAAGALTTACAKPATPSSRSMALGAPEAKVTLIEYASTMCGHCAHFHETVYPQLKSTYIDTKKIKFEFREFATAPRDITYAQFLIARCAGKTPEKYMDVIGMFMRQQRAVAEAVGSGQAREKLLEIAKSAGLSEEQFTQCVSDEAASARIREGEQAAARDFKIDSTPSLVLNNKLIPNTATEPYTFERLSKLIDAEL